MLDVEVDAQGIAGYERDAALDARRNVEAARLCEQIGIVIEFTHRHFRLIRETGADCVRDAPPDTTSKSPAE